MSKRLTVALLTGFLIITAGCGPDDDKAIQGYVEGQFTYVAAPAGGRVQALHVERGQKVKAGTELFNLDPQPEADAAEEAAAAVAQAESTLANLKKGSRPTEIQAIEAQLSQAQSNLTLSKTQYLRRKKLYSEKAVPESEYDTYHTAYLADKATVENIQAQLATARLGARIDAIEAAANAVRAYREKLKQAQWLADQKTQYAQTGALVFDTLFTKGEYAPAGSPVVQLLAPGDIKLRFFVPEPVIGSVKPGQKIRFGCDGCPEGMTATINYISPQVEYTPPVIYSVNTRRKLVFMVEAKPDGDLAKALHPGQPIDVRHAAGASAGAQ